MSGEVSSCFLFFSFFILRIPDSYEGIIVEELCSVLYLGLNTLPFGSTHSFNCTDRKSGWDSLVVNN